MEWIIGIYLVVGVFKALGRYGNTNPALKPVWMVTERNPLKIALFLTLYAVTWPFAGK